MRILIKSSTIEFFNNAISMDDNLVDAYVAKGCALANIVRL